MDLEADNQHKGAAASARPLTFHDWIVPVVIFVFCGVVAYFAVNLDTAPPIVIGEAMQPRSFPIFLVSLIAILNCIIIWQMLAGERTRVGGQTLQTWISIALLGLFYLLTTTVDMFVALAVVIFLMTLVWGERRIWVAGLLALVTPTVIFFFFDLVLKVRFPRGLLTELYYG